MSVVMANALGTGIFSDSGKVSVQFLDLLPGWASSAVLLISQPDVEKPVLLNPCAVTMLVFSGVCVLSCQEISTVAFCLVRS